MGEVWPEDNSLEKVRASKDEWHSLEKRRTDFEQKANENPGFYASSAFYFIRGTRRHLRRLLRRRFGVKVRYHWWRSEQYVASRKRFPVYPPRTPQDYYDYVQFRVMSNLLRVHDELWAAMHSAYIKAHRDGEDSDMAALSALFRVAGSGPWSATPTNRTEPDDFLREMSAITVAGWVGSHVSLGANKRLNAVLSEQTGGSRGRNFAEFMRNLVPATTVAWEELQPDEPLRPGNRETNLVSRVERLLINEGNEAAKLEREGKLASLENGLESDGGDCGSEDVDLEEFERQETLRQQSNALQGWVERARFSEQERRVYELDKLMSEDTEAIAHELGISGGHVRVVRKNYRDKLRKVARP
jgi:hypothetical protein